ncbi:hypothetical protein, partial [Ruegeria sp. Ofav3-42]|uniref:hypothetical protein n=1 Tax=Ruegeria sp. Ofav3-42 TaxID=2917759 RepID=UPI001EF417BA
LACFLFLDHLDDLFVGESRLHLSVLKLGGLYTKLEEIQGLRSPTINVKWHPACEQSWRDLIGVLQ